ncbi:MAG: LptA/OstA family protein [Vulcanimicrobiaceae bacterium]
MMIRMTATAVAACLLLAAMPAAHVAAPPKTPSSKLAPGQASFTFGDWIVHTKTLDYNWNTGDFSAPNPLTMTRSDGNIRADRATGNAKRKIATLYGHVVLHDLRGNLAGLGSKGSSHGPATLKADRLQLNGVTKVYIATGHVYFTQNDTTVNAQKGTLNDATHILVLVGKVHMVQGAQSMLADHVRYDTVTGEAHARGDVTLQFPSNFHPHIATPKPIIIKNPKIGHRRS